MDRNGIKLRVKNRDECEVRSGVIDCRNMNSFWLSMGAWFLNENKRDTQKLFSRIKKDLYEKLDRESFKNDFITTDTIPGVYKGTSFTYCSIEFNIYLNKKMDKHLLTKKVDEIVDYLLPHFFGDSNMTIKKRR